MLAASVAVLGGAAQAKQVPDRPGLLSSVTASCCFKTVNSYCVIHFRPAGRAQNDWSVNGH